VQDRTTLIVNISKTLTPAQFDNLLKSLVDTTAGPCPKLVTFPQALLDKAAAIRTILPEAAQATLDDIHKLPTMVNEFRRSAHSAEGFISQINAHNQLRDSFSASIQDLQRRINSESDDGRARFL
jgi:hypothetical protein